MDKLELIRTMREAHRRVAGAIEHLTDDRLLEPVMDNWTGKDLVAHMAWWHDHSALVIACLRAGRQRSHVPVLVEVSHPVGAGIG